MLSLSLTGTSPTLALPQTFINQQVQGAFVIWNYGGGRLTGTVSAPAPFSIVSGGSFSLLPGQPQEVVVRFSSGTAGSFSKSIAISSNGGNATVTATAVAHKVSFSPAPLDFGNGLLVMREQCNQMGMCGLRTEKVGLPIEKALTVKNEGTVSVSLTLSTAGPYKIVSVPPTLSPGQSAQVILRFDPSRMVYVAPRVAVEEVESGEFRGSLQVGISEGQGSLTVPLVGTAHKIEIRPTVLDFGIVPVGSTKERKLTVKNQGVTTVRLEVPNTTTTESSSFTVVLEQPLTLSPGESKEISVKCSPTTSGVFQKSVRLMSGSVILGIPAIVRTMTYEEYLQALLEAHSTIVQDLGAYGMVYGWNKYKQFDFIAAGFPGMGATDFESLWDFAEQMLHSSPDVQIDPTTADKLRRVLEMLQAINPDDLTTWMELLSAALEQGRFDEEYERLLSQGLDRYQAIFVNVLGLSPQDARDIIRELVESLMDLSLFFQDQQIPEPYATQIRKAMRYVELRLKILFALPEGILSAILGIMPQIARLLGLPGLTPFDLIDLTIQRWDTAIRTMIALGFSPGEMVMFSWAIRDLYAHMFQVLEKALQEGEASRIISEWIKILLRTGEFAKFFDWMSSPYIPRTQRDRSEQGLGTIYIAANAVRTGWQYNGLVLDLQGSYTQKYGEWWGASVLLSKENSVSGRSILTLARGDHCTQCGGKAQEIGDWVERALQLLPVEVSWYGADLGVITVVFTNPDSQDIANTILPKLQKRFGESDKIIIVSWMDSNGRIWWSCIGACNNLKPGEAEQIACNMHGFSAGCGAQEWSDYITLPWSEVKNPVTITTEPVDWYEADPWYFTREWLCSMTRAQAAGQGLEGLWDSLCG
jgi:hypothetical protein